MRKKKHSVSFKTLAGQITGMTQKLAKFAYKLFVILSFLVKTISPENIASPLLLPSLLVYFKIRIITLHLQFIAKFPAAVMAESIDIDDIESQVWKSDSPTIDSAAQFR